MNHDLTQLLAGDDVVVLLTGQPGESGVAVLSFTSPTSEYQEHDVAILDELYVRPQLRGHRLGSALLDAGA